MSRADLKTWGQLEVGDVIVRDDGSRRTVKVIWPAKAPGYLVVGLDDGSETGGHRLGGELRIERDGQ